MVELLPMTFLVFEHGYFLFVVIHHSFESGYSFLFVSDRLSSSFDCLFKFLDQSLILNILVAWSILQIAVLVS
jgi:hypothetical protein